MQQGMTLMSRIAAGDDEALRICIRDNQRLVRSLARRMTKSADVDDAVQDVFVDVWRSAARYDGRVSERSFVAMIARRRLVDRLRRSSRRPATEALTAPAPCENAPQRMEARSEIAMADKRLRELRPVQRDVLLLSAMGGMSHSEISVQLKMPLGTVKAHARRGMAELRRSLS